MLEVEKEEWDAVSASDDGTDETVLVEALPVRESEAPESEVADSEAADSADDMPSVSSEGCHMKAPTYACALQQECKSMLLKGGWCLQACKQEDKVKHKATSYSSMLQMYSMHIANLVCCSAWIARCMTCQTWHMQYQKASISSLKGQQFANLPICLV